MLFNSKTKARQTFCLAGSVRASMSSTTGRNRPLQPHREMIIQLVLTGLALECLTDLNDTKTKLTPAGKLPFHLHIEVLGLEREQRRRWRKKKTQALIKRKIRDSHIFKDEQNERKRKKMENGQRRVNTCDASFSVCQR